VSRAATPTRRQRILQIGFVLAAFGVVFLADRIAAQVLRIDTGPNARQIHGTVVLGGRIVAGWALGLAFRIQLAVRGNVEPDRLLRRAVAVPASLLAAWPILHVRLPARVAGSLPAWATTGGVFDLAPIAALTLGLVVALGVTPTRRR
jgi:hypothetical protein